MPLELAAVASVFGLHSGGDDVQAPWIGEVGGSSVVAVHGGMGPARTRTTAVRLLEEGLRDGRRVDHMMIVGICGGLDPALPVGTLISPQIIVDHSRGLRYRHQPPGAAPLRGSLVTTETVLFDLELNRRLFAEGCIAVDMESAAVAEVCEARRVPWSVYRCISDRYVDGLLDARVVALTNPDGSLNDGALTRLLAEEPEAMTKLQQLGRDSERAAHLAAEAALRGCLALDG
jgi:adenosylhomocysteine nucleosidase